jgi:hypothetical protein
MAESTTSAPCAPDPCQPGQPGVGSASSASPAALLRQRLTHGHGRLLVLLAMAVVWLMDTLLVDRIKAHHLAASSFTPILSGIEHISTVVFAVVTVGLGLSLYRFGQRHLVFWGLSYLVVAMVQVFANVLSMVMTASHVKGEGLLSLWDVAGVYMETVIVFTFIYIMLDISIPGGAFIWPSREGQPAAMPHLIDYLFLALNTNSTYGPTSEVVISRIAKLTMALQILLAMLMLTVLISRAVGA